MNRGPSVPEEHAWIGMRESQFQERIVTSPIFLSPGISTRLKPRLFDASTLKSAMPSARKVLFSAPSVYDDVDQRTRTDKEKEKATNSAKSCRRIEMETSSNSEESSVETRIRRKLEESQVRVEKPFLVASGVRSILS